MSTLRLGKLAVAHNFISKKQLDECLSLQKASPVPVRIGRLLLDEGLITERALKSLLALHGDQTAPVNVERQQRLETARPTDLAGMFALAHELGASRVCLSDGARPFLHLAGEIVSLQLPVVDAAERERYLGAVLTPSRRQELVKRGSVSFRYGLEDGTSVVAQACRQRSGLSVVFKIIPPRIPTLGDLGLPPLLEQVTGFHRGLVLITGPAGSGRSTTLASLVECFNEQVSRRIVTLEDTIEFQHCSRGCLITQCEVPRHAPDYPTALRRALRCDPDVIVISDLCGRAQIECALLAAETGHVVLGCMSTPNTMQTLHRLLNTFAGPGQAEKRNQLADSLRLIVSQQQVPRRDSRGQALACELLLVDAPVAHIIRDNRLHQLHQVLQLGAARGMTSMDSSLRKLVQDGVVDHNIALQRTEDLRSWLKDSGDQT